VDILSSARPGWHILRWSRAGHPEVVRTNVNRHHLEGKLHTANEVLRNLYEWQLAQLPT
jgi:hypothetical protein